MLFVQSGANRICCTPLPQADPRSGNWATGNKGKSCIPELYSEAGSPAPSQHFPEQNVRGRWDQCKKSGHFSHNEDHARRDGAHLGALVEIEGHEQQHHRCAVDLQPDDHTPSLSDPPWGLRPSKFEPPRANIPSDCGRIYDAIRLNIDLWLQHCRNSRDSWFPRPFPTVSYFCCVGV